MRELSADVAAARVQVRSVASSLLRPLLDTVYGHDPVQRAAKGRLVERVLDKLESGELCAMDLEAVLSDWRVAWSRYRNTQTRCPCQTERSRIPQGRHCLPCGEFHLCARCWSKHADCEGRG